MFLVSSEKIVHDISGKVTFMKRYIRLLDMYHFRDGSF